LGARIILMEAKNVQSLVLDIVNLPESDSGTQFVIVICEVYVTAISLGCQYNAPDI